MPAGFARMTKGVASWGWSTVAEASQRARRLVHAGQGDRRRLVDQRQLYTRGNAKDYDAWASEAGATGWSYREALPYFKRSEGQREAPQRLPERMAAAWRILSDQSRRRSATRSCAPRRNWHFFQRRFQRRGPGRHWPLPAFHPQRRTLFDVIGLREADREQEKPFGSVNAQTLKIEVQNGRAMGVTVVSGTGTADLKRGPGDHPEAAARSARPGLLQLSGIGPADALKTAGRRVVHDLPGVGSNMQDHFDLYAISECTGEHTYDRIARPHRTAWAGLQYLAFKTGPVTSTLLKPADFGTRTSKHDRRISNSILASARASRRVLPP